MTTHTAVSTLRRRGLPGAALAATAIAIIACGDNAAPTRPLLPAVNLVPSTGASFGKGGSHGGTVPILFASNRDGNYEIYKMNADGSGQTRLTFDRSSDYEAVASPDGTKIAFVSTRQNGLGEIYTMNADGSGVTRLTISNGASLRPSWAPDGAKIVFESTRDAADPTNLNVAAAWEIYTMNANGSNVVRITNNMFADRQPAWSADGKHIAFSSDRDHVGGTARDLYVMDPDGANVKRITNQDGTVLSPSWDSKSRNIAFGVMTPAVAPGVYVVDLTTMVTKGVSVGSTPDDLWPSWSPDGTQLAYMHYALATTDIYVMNADGTGKKQLTTNAAADGFPSWSR